MPTKKSSKKARAATKPRTDESKYAAMIEEATTDAYDESEQTAGWYAMFEEHVTLVHDSNSGYSDPFPVSGSVNSVAFGHSQCGHPVQDSASNSCFYPLSL